MLTAFVINHLLQITIVVSESENIPPIPHPHNPLFYHAPLEIEKHPHPISRSFAETNKCGKRRCVQRHERSNMQICFNFKQRELYIWLWIDIRSLFIAIEVKETDQ
jgi:hypothetical protein